MDRTAAEHDPDERKEHEMSLVIDCTNCPDRTEDAECADCIVCYILDRPEGAVVFDVEEARAIRALREGGLLPGVRLDAETG